jgi:CDP-diacylglycerol--serine O-phosphatidyltransferase
MPPPDPQTNGGDSSPREGFRARILNVPLLPTLATVFNGLAGFASIHFATKDPFNKAEATNLAIAAWLILAAMICDMLDGRLARMTRKTSDFGGQLDSMCDVISFGVAPAALMLRTVTTALHGQQFDRIGWMPEFIPHFTLVDRAVWCIAAVYVACAVLRLARFNVENEPDESAHMTFKGLPAPGAAAAVVAMVLLFVHFADVEKGWRASPTLLAAVSITLPVITLLAAVLMVSNFSYSHVVNRALRSNRPFGQVVKIVLIVVFAIIELFATGAVLALSFMASGPVRWFWRKTRWKNAAGHATATPRR